MIFTGNERDILTINLSDPGLTPEEIAIVEGNAK